MTKPGEPKASKGWKARYDVLILTGFYLSLITIGQTLSWSDHWAGFINGVSHSLFFGIPILLSSTLWVFIAGLISKHLKFPKLRSLIIYLPAIAMVSGVVHSQISSEQRFRSLTGKPLPPDATIVSEHHSGGLLADPSHSYHLKMSATATHQIIEDLQLHNHDRVDEISTQDPEIDPEKYSFHYWNHNTGENRYYDLYTDEDHQLVYLRIFSI